MINVAVWIHRYRLPIPLLLKLQIQFTILNKRIILAFHKLKLEARVDEST